MGLFIGIILNFSLFAVSVWRVDYRAMYVLEE